MIDPQPAPGEGEAIGAALPPGDPCFQADLLMLLRTALVDGPLNRRGSEALRRVAIGLGVSADEVPALLGTLDPVSPWQAMSAFHAMDEARRRQLLFHLAGVVRGDPHLAGLEPRLMLRLAAVFDVPPDMMEGPVSG